jgi:hypothetical protein
MNASGPDQGGEKHMLQSEQFEVLVLGSGTGGKLVGSLPKLISSSMAA